MCCQKTHQFVAHVEDVRSSLKMDWKMMLSHTYRIGNTIANCLANIADDRPIGFQEKKKAKLEING